jgi:murein DD-endopeptidase MepM/ murein hydrolase activator NlpD
MAFSIASGPRAQAADSAPPSTATASGSLPAAGCRPMVALTKERDGDVLHFYIENLEVADVTATFELGLSNLKGSTNFPYTATFPPHQKTEAFSLSPVCLNQTWGYALTNHCSLGGLRAVHDDSYIYGLPYPAGQSFRVSQGYDGKFSHKGSERFAIDWKMPEGTPVLAARGGMVVDVKDDSSVGGPDRKFLPDANYVVIQHVDGTLGKYAHLLKGSARVRAGDIIEPGGLIALSGNTGFSSGPHLHFIVYRTTNGMSRESLPIRFRAQSQAAVTLQQGRVYRAPQLMVASDRKRNDAKPN